MRGTARSSFPFTHLRSAQRWIRFTRGIRAVLPTLIARLSPMVSPTLYWSQPGHGPNIHLVLRDRERPRINLLSIQPPIHPFYFPFHSILSIKHRYSRLSRVLSGLSLCWVGSSFVFFPRFHRANDFHRHVPRHCEIKPLTIALIIRGTRGGGVVVGRSGRLRCAFQTWHGKIDRAVISR